MRTEYGELVHHLKQSNTPFALAVKRAWRGLRSFSVALPKPMGALLFRVVQSIQSLMTGLSRVFWWTPIFKGRVGQCGSSLYLYGGLPYISDPLKIELGDHCRISGQTTFTGRAHSCSVPTLQIGSNVDIGWQTTIAVGRSIVLGDNVRIAGRALLAGYPGHPLAAKPRAQGLPCTDDQVGDIYLANDVWLATGVTVLAGVSIGAGTIVAAGSVVTKDLPANVLAGGNPARVIRSLPEAEGGHHG